MTETLSWKRGVSSRSAFADRMTWHSKCGRYKVAEFSNRPGGESDIYYAVAIRVREGCRVEEIIGRKKRRDLAKSCCEKDNRLMEKFRK